MENIKKEVNFPQNSYLRRFCSLFLLLSFMLFILTQNYTQNNFLESKIYQVFYHFSSLSQLKKKKHILHFHSSNLIQNGNDTRVVRLKINYSWHNWLIWFWRKRHCNRDHWIFSKTKRLVYKYEHVYVKKIRFLCVFISQQNIHSNKKK